MEMQVTEVIRHDAKLLMCAAHL